MVAQLSNANPTESHIISFYVVTEGRPPQNAPIAFDTSHALQEISRLPLSLKDGVVTRYMHTMNGKSLHTILDSSLSEVHFRLCEVDREHLPQTEKEGIVDDLSLEEGRGLFESSHGIVFRPGLIGAIGTNGPDMPRLARYITNKCGLANGQLRIVPLIAADILDRMSRLEAISLFRFKISPSQFPIIRGTWNNLDDILEAQLAMWGEQTTLEVLIRPTNDSRRGARNTILTPLIALASPDIRSLLAGAATYKIKGRLEGQAHDVMLDVLADSLTTEEEVVRKGPASSALDDNSAYDAIKSAYSALQPDIEAALENSNIQGARR